MQGRIYALRFSILIDFYIFFVLVLTLLFYTFLHKDEASLQR